LCVSVNEPELSEYHLLLKHKECDTSLFSLSDIFGVLQAKISVHASESPFFNPDPAELTMGLFGWNPSRPYSNWIYPPYIKQPNKSQL